ncbi:MAG: hypothetical protein H6719_26225 [Sandaracinaceae bacterium]|nr:hypothetical protein [Sandaracinaceae bacterium]
MSQRASLRVPAPSPATSLNLGTAWGAMDWTSDGFSATTRGRIWLEAHGAKGSSSLSILSNGPDGVGQLLLQSLERHVHLMAKGTTVAAANGSLLVAGRQSVKLYGNLGLDPMELLMPLTGEDPPVRHVHPSETDPSANGARALVTEYERVADHWAIGEAITLGLATTATYVRKMLGAAGSGDTQGFASTVAGLAASATVFSGLASAARLLDDEVPGLHVSSFGGINIGTPAFAALYGGAAALVTGGLFNAFGLDTHAIAGVNAGLRSMFYVKVEGSEVEATAGVDVEMASRADYVKLYGSQIAIGSTVPTAPLQLPTDTCTTSVAGPVLLGANMGRVFLSSQGAVEMSAPEVAVKTLEGIAIRHPGYVIEVSPTGVTLQVLSSSVRVDSTLVDAQIGPSTLSAGNTLQIACGGSELEATNTGATLNGPVVVFS